MLTLGNLAYKGPVMKILIPNPRALEQNKHE